MHMFNKINIYERIQILLSFRLFPIFPKIPEISSPSLSWSHDSKNFGSDVIWSNECILIMWSAPQSSTAVKLFLNRLNSRLSPYQRDIWEDEDGTFLTLNFQPKCKKLNLMFHVLKYQNNGIQDCYSNRTCWRKVIFRLRPFNAFCSSLKGKRKVNHQ